jgi:hypothetical protein
LLGGGDEAGHVAALLYVLGLPWLWVTWRVVHLACLVGGWGGGFEFFEERNGKRESTDNFGYNCMWCYWNVLVYRKYGTFSKFRTFYRKQDPKNVDSKSICSTFMQAKRTNGFSLQHKSTSGECGTKSKVKSAFPRHRLQTADCRGIHPSPHLPGLSNTTARHSSLVLCIHSFIIHSFPHFGFVFMSYSCS